MHEDEHSQLQFADERAPIASAAREPWTILLVDDEESVHEVTRLALTLDTRMD